MNWTWLIKVAYATYTGNSVRIYQEIDFDSERYDNIEIEISLRLEQMENIITVLNMMFDVKRDKINKILKFTRNLNPNLNIDMNYNMDLYINE